MANRPSRKPQKKTTRRRTTASRRGKAKAFPLKRAALAAFLLVALGMALGLALSAWTRDDGAAPVVAETVVEPPPPTIRTPMLEKQDNLPPLPPPPPLAVDPAPVVIPQQPAVPPKAAAEPSRVEEAALPPPVSPMPEKSEELPPWQRYAVPMPQTNGRPMIAIVIDDMGLDRRRSDLIAALPGPLTTAWLPYARDLPRQTAAARARGHELIVHVPMEPQNPNVDAGPDVLRVGLPPEEIRRRLISGLESFDGHIGINNHMGSKFTEDLAGMSVVMEELKERGLMFLDSRTSPVSVGVKAAQQADVPNAGRHIFLDNDDDATLVLGQLAKTEEVARRHGMAIAIGHPRDGTIEALRQWLPTLEQKGYVLVPLSAIIRKRYAKG
ncbi:divergent polysaccharide deacetylase family protein [Telmatospirillum sp. J64-1]|uniref:divergent polysaccharide deacetylase family protein n=1 Tax=Telmatospirillum sp. J64-1 TaxID=2502183 RepID=UPI0021047DCF|nr:divergent polysaccharide deacetylase family protein [Telmatospirillum sp. J64-1]